MLFLIFLGAISNTTKNVLVHISLLITLLFWGKNHLKRSSAGSGCVHNCNPNGYYLIILPKSCNSSVMLAMYGEMGRVKGRFFKSRRVN